MVKIDEGLIREVRETTDWLLSFPAKLVSAIMMPREAYFGRRERIDTLKEMVDIREIIKDIQRLYFFKGNLVQCIREVQSAQHREEAALIRDIFVDVKQRVDDIRKSIARTAFSNANLVAEASMFLARAERAYHKLSELPDDVLWKDEAIAEIALLLEEIVRQAAPLLKKLDEHRRLLDHTYGD